LLRIWMWDLQSKLRRQWCRSSFD